MFPELDPLLMSQLRLAVVSYLAESEEADFNTLREKTGATAGNLSAQITKLQTGGYVSVEKSFRNNYPHTRCRLTPEGLAAFERFVDQLQRYFPDRKNK
ncbi:MAG: winged helix-turn-helix domain-containing protein [Saprospiraceae bacterium]